MSRRPFRLALNGKNLTATLALALGMALALPCSHAERNPGPQQPLGRTLPPVERAQPASFGQTLPPAASRPFSRQQRWVF